MKLTDTFDFSASEWKHLIDEWIFNEEHRNIMKRHLLDGIGYGPLADEFHYSVRQIKNIVYKSEIRIIKHIK